MAETTVPLISIVTPSLNQLRFLRACVASVDLQLHDGVEHLVIDGGSHDGTAAFLSQTPGRIAFWRSTADRGQGDALNIGISHARGDWIGWQNADDYYLPGAFSRLVAAIGRHPDARVVVGDVALVDVDGRSLGSVGVAPVHPRRWLDGFWPYNQGVFFHREVLSAAGPIDIDLHLHMDTDLLARVAELAPRVAYLDAVLGAYRQHPDAKTHRGEDDPRSRAERQRLETRYEHRLWPRRGAGRAVHRLASHVARIRGFGPGSVLRRLAQRWASPRRETFVCR